MEFCLFIYSYLEHTPDPPYFDFGIPGGRSRVLLEYDSQVSYRFQNLFILPPVMEARSLQDVCFIHKLGLLFTVVEESGKRDEGI